MNSTNDVVVTLYTDWAPDVAIDSAAETLLTHRVKATWFVTHQSPAIDRLRAHRDLFELGIHPNFLPGSSHGATPQEGLARCMAIVPRPPACGRTPWSSPPRSSGTCWRRLRCEWTARSCCTGLRGSR